LLELRGRLQRHVIPDDRTIAATPDDFFGNAARIAFALEICNDRAGASRGTDFGRELAQSTRSPNNERGLAGKFARGHTLADVRQCGLNNGLHPNARRDYAAETRALDAHADEPKAIVYLLHRKTHMIATIILQKRELSAHKERVQPWAFHSNKARKCGNAAKAPSAKPSGRMRILVLKYQG
jgi:hypothetical protein